MMSMIVVNESLWLIYKYIFYKMALKKGIIHIKLTKQPTISNRKIENKVNGGTLDYWEP